MTTNLMSSLLPASSRQAILPRLAMIAAGIGLLTLSAKVQVPFWPVPMTMQTFVVLMIGATYGLRNGLATLAGWLALGAVGVPVFASGAGLAYMAGPTGGYLAGFAMAVVVLGAMADRGMGRTILSAIAMAALGEILIFGFGVAWLSALIGPAKAIAGGLVPFIPAEVLKAALVIAALQLGWKQAKA